jgi:hypothetical protein
MNQAILLTLVEQKQTMRYLNTVGTADKAVALDKLARCIYFGILSTLLPFAPPEQHLEIAQLFAGTDALEQKKWVQDLPEGIQLQMKETIQRIFLSLEKSV